MNMYRNKAALVLALSTFVLTSACNTIEGAGRDIKSAGKTIEKTAKHVKD